MGTEYSVKAVFSAMDNMSPVMGNIKSSMQKMGGMAGFFSNKFKNDIAKAEEKMAEFGQSIKRWGSMAMQQGLREAGAFFKDSVQKYIDFEDSITQAGAKFSDLDVTSSDFTQHLKEMQNAAMKVGAETKFSATDAAGALDKMAMAGIKSQDAMSMLRGTADLAAATNLDLTSAVDMATDAMGAFKISGNEDAFGKLAQWNGFEGIAANINHVADVVSKATNLANLDMNMWFDSVKNGASTFTSFGGTMEQFTGMAMALANAGIKGGDAGTALRNVMLKLGAPTSTAAKALEELGIGIYESDGSMRNIMDIMKDFETNLAGISGEKKNNLLNDIFGARSVGSFLTLMNAGTDSINKYIEALENSQGTAGNVAKTMNQSIKGQITLLGSAIEGIKLNIGRAFAESGGNATLQKIIEAIQGIKQEQLVAFVSGLTQAVAGFVVGLASVAGFLWKIRLWLLPIVAGLVAYKAIVIGSTIALWAKNSAMLAFATVTGTATAAQTGLNVAMAANPAGLIIAGIVVGIGLIVGLIILIRKHWDGIVAVVGQFWENVVGVVSAVGQAVGGFFVNVFNGIKAGFVALIGFLKDALLGVLQPWLLIMQSVTWVLSKIPGIGGAFGKINGGIAGLTGFDGGNLFGDADSGGGVENIAPVTNAERTVYEESKQTTTSNVTIGLEKPLKISNAVGIPQTMQFSRSGAF